MKRLMLAAVALAAVAGPLAVSTEASAQGRNDRRDDQRYNDRWDDRRGNDRWDDRRDNRGRNDRYDNRGRRDNDWNRGNNNRWDDRRYNGYYVGNRWYYGPPPATYYGRNDFRPGWQAWQRGGYLPPAYRSYVVYDYGRYRLRQPPRGYHWVRHNNDYILAAIATGLILEVISGAF